MQKQQASHILAANGGDNVVQVIMQLYYVLNVECCRVSSKSGKHHTQASMSMICIYFCCECFRFPFLFAKYVNLYDSFRYSHTTTASQPKKTQTRKNAKTKRKYLFVIPACFKCSCFKFSFCQNMPDSNQT